MNALRLAATPLAPSPWARSSRTQPPRAYTSSSPSFGGDGVLRRPDVPYLSDEEETFAATRRAAGTRARAPAPVAPPAFRSALEQVAYETNARLFSDAPKKSLWAGLFGGR
jgi:hypothetical protein